MRLGMLGDEGSTHPAPRRTRDQQRNFQITTPCGGISGGLGARLVCRLPDRGSRLAVEVSRIASSHGAGAGAAAAAPHGLTAGFSRALVLQRAGLLLLPSPTSEEREVS